MQQGLLYANITTLALSEAIDGGIYAFPQIPAGSTLILPLRLAEDFEASPVLSTRVVHAIKVSIGRPDKRPESGGYMLHVGDVTAGSTNTTAVIQFSDLAADVAGKINALTDTSLAAKLPCTAVDDNGSVLVTFKDKSLTTLTVTENSLNPIAFVDSVAQQFDGGYRYEIRLTEAPIAQSVTFASIVPTPPSVSENRAGNGELGATVNERQLLTLPPQFSGSFDLKRGSIPSAPIGLPTSGAEILKALAPLADPGGNFTVTELQDAVLIEFQGSMGGQGQPLLEVEIIAPPPGDIVVALKATGPAMDAMIRRVDSTGQILLALEIELWTINLQDNTLYDPHKFRTPVAFIPGVSRDDQNISAALDWNHPPAGTRYTPFSADNIVIGERHYPQIDGDGAATSFVVNHHFASDFLRVDVRENASGGRQLVDGTDFEVHFTNTNSTLITWLGAAPALNAILIVISTTNAPATFLAHTHDIGDINGLATLLGNYGQRIQALEIIGGINANSAAGQTANTLTTIAEWDLPAVSEIYPTRKPLPITGATLSSVDKTKLPRTGGLLPAVTVASVDTLTVPVPAPSLSFAGHVYQNTSGNPVIIGGGLGIKGVTIPNNGFVACDGRLWYQVVKYASAEKTYYPLAFERTLALLAVNAQQFQVGTTFSMPFGIELGLFNEDTSITWSLVVEWAAITSDASPSPAGSNLADLVFNATPILEQRIIVTRTPCVHPFAVTLARSMPSFALSCGTTNTSPVITTPTTARLFPGMSVSGTGIPDGATVLNIIGAGSFTLSANATATGSPSLAFVGDQLTTTKILYGVPSAAPGPPNGTQGFAIRIRMIRADTQNITAGTGFVGILGLDRSTAGADTTNIGKALITLTGLA